jgi:hypothetical protein
MTWSTENSCCIGEKKNIYNTENQSDTLEIVLILNNERNENNFTHASVEQTA